MDEPIREPTFLERITPVAPVARPDAVLWAGWLNLAAVLCLAVLFADVWTAELRAHPGDVSSLPSTVEWLLVIVVGTVGLGVWVGYATVTLRPRQGFGRKRSGYAIVLVVVALLQLVRWRWQSVMLLFDENGWTLGSPGAIDEVVRLGLFGALMAVLLLMILVARDMSARTEFAEAFTAAEAERPQGL